MPFSYSIDLRKKCVAALENGTPLLRLSKTLNIARNTLTSWRKNFKNEGSTIIKKYKTGPKPVIQNLEEFKEFVSKKPDRTQKELSEEWSEKFRPVSPRTISTVLKKCKFTYKKKLLAIEKETKKQGRNF